MTQEYDTPTRAPLLRHRTVLAVLAALFALAAGVAAWLVLDGGGSAPEAQPRDDPVLFLREIVRGIARNEYDRIWPSLHPAQQRIATRRLYVRCEASDPVAGRLETIEVVKALDQPIVVPGAGTRLVDSKAVTFRLTLAESTGRTSGDVTAHAVAVDGHWRWILTRSRFEVYRSGSCPVAEPPAPSA